MTTPNQPSGSESGVDWQGRPVDWTPKPFVQPTIAPALPAPDTQDAQVPFQTHRKTPQADATDPMYTRDRERIWHDSTLSSSDRVRVVLGDLHTASRLIGDPLTIRSFLSEIGALEPRAEWFSSDAVADAARLFSSAWRDVGAPILVANLDDDAEAVQVAARTYFADDQAAADGYTKVLNQALSAQGLIDG
jgi:hypothetical protein